MNHFFEQPDSLTLVDTSQEFQADPLPDWVLRHLAAHFGGTPVPPPVRPAESIDEVRQRYNTLKASRATPGPTATDLP